MSKNAFVSFPDLWAIRRGHTCTNFAVDCPVEQVYTHMQHMIHGLMISNAALARAAAPQLDNIAIIVAQGKQLDALQDEFAETRMFFHSASIENKRLRAENRRLTRALRALTTDNSASVYTLDQNTLRNL